MTNHTDILSQAIHTLRERGSQYGSVEATFDRAAKLATLMLNTEITAYEIAMMHVATKMARLQESRTLDDNYVDAMNYLAFAAQFAPVHEPPKVTEAVYRVPAAVTMKNTDAMVEEGVAEIAKMLQNKAASQAAGEDKPKQD